MLRENYELQNYDEYLPDVMNCFRCNRTMAKTILESSKMNGKIDTIKKQCEEYRKGNDQHG